MPLKIQTKSDSMFIIKSFITEFAVPGQIFTMRLKQSLSATYQLLLEISFFLLFCNCKLLSKTIQLLLQMSSW